MSVRELTRCAVMTALLIALQFALSFVSGVELVTAVFAAFCYSCGFRAGALTGAAFSLLRCIIYGFLPNVVALYLIYYTLFAAVFGILRRRDLPEAFWIGLCAVCSAAFFAAGFLRIPISSVYRLRLRAAFFVAAAIFAALAGFGLAVKAGKKGFKKHCALLGACASASAMTVVFSLLDDVITPLFLGFSGEAATAYFYSSLLTMLPQTVCAAVSVFLLFEPLVRSMRAGE